MRLNSFHKRQIVNAIALHANKENEKEIEANKKSIDRVARDLVEHVIRKDDEMANMLLTQIQDIQSENKQFEKSINENNRRISAAVEGFSTLNSLKKGWPEVVSIVEKLNLDGSVPTNKNLSIITQLNQEFKLPPVEVVV